MWPRAVVPRYQPLTHKEGDKTKSTILESTTVEQGRPSFGCTTVPSAVAERRFLENSPPIHRKRHKAARRFFSTAKTIKSTAKMNFMSAISLPSSFQRETITVGSKRPITDAALHCNRTAEGNRRASTIFAFARIVRRPHINNNYAKILFSVFIVRPRSYLTRKLRRDSTGCVVDRFRSVPQSPSIATIFLFASETIWKNSRVKTINTDPTSRHYTYQLNGENITDVTRYWP